MSIGLGIKGAIQFGREATWATPATVNRRLAFLGGKIDAKPIIAISNQMPGSGIWLPDALVSGGVSAGAEVVGEYAEGQVELYLDYEGLLQPFDMLYGGAAYGSWGATTTGPSGGNYTHVFTEKEFFNSVTMEFIEGLITSGKCSQIPGAKVAAVTISVKAAGGEAGWARMTIDWVGQQKVLTQNITGAITAVQRLPVLFSHATAFNDGSGDSGVVLREFELKITPAQTKEDRFGIGSPYILEPVRKGLVNATMKFVREYTSDTLMTAYKAGTVRATTGGAGNLPSITFTGAASRSIKFECAAAILEAAPQPTPNLDGLMMQEVTWRALYDSAAGFGLKTTIINTQSSASA